MAKDVSIFSLDPDLTSQVEHGADSLIQSHRVDVRIDGTEIRPTSIKVKTNRLTEAGRADVVGLWQGEDIPPKGETLEVQVNGILLFTGRVRKASLKGDGSVEVVAFDAIKDLLQLKINLTFNQVDMDFVANVIKESVDVGIEKDLPARPFVEADYNDTPGTQVLNQIAKWSDVVWWVNEENDIVLKEPDPTLYEIGAEFIKSEDADAGEEEQPYQRVIVKGESPASERGLETSHMLSKEPVVSKRGSGSPVYQYQSKLIKTQEQADRVATAILKEFQRQRASGGITIVGEGSPIRPFDGIILPPELGEFTFLVSGITHTFTNEDGFISEISVGSFVDDE